MSADAISSQQPSAWQTLENWGALTLQQESIPGALRGEVNALIETLGIVPELAACLVCSFIGALAGASFSIRSPHGYRLPVSLNFVMVTEAPIHLRGALRALFEPLTTVVKDRVRTARLEDPSRLVESRTQYRIKLLNTQDIIDGTAPPPKRPMALLKDGQIQAGIEAFEDSFRKKDAAREKVKLLARLSNVEFKLRPDFVAEGLEAAMLLHPEVLSYDDAIHNLSLAGETLSSCASAPPEIIHQLSQMLRASWFGLPLVRDPQDRTPQTLISNLWIVSPQAASEALNSDWAKSGLTETFAFLDVNTDCKPARIDTSDAWLRTLNYIWDNRGSHPPSEHHLGAEGAPLFFEFADELNTIYRWLPEETKSFALHWPDLALKLALLLHLGGHDPEPWKEDLKEEYPAEPRIPVPPPAEIGKATIEAALTITKHIAARHVSLSSRLYWRVPDTEIDSAVETMVRKLRIHQPATKRTLFRSYAIQKSKTLGPILEKALLLGLIQTEGGLLSVTETAVSKNRQCQSVSGVSERNSEPLPPENVPEVSSK